jgi:hypothetical protein
MSDRPAYCRAWFALILERGPLIDINGIVSAALRDFAWVQSSTQSRWGYKRAAAARLIYPDQEISKIQLARRLSPRRLTGMPHGVHDHPLQCLFLSSQSIGSHSSTLLPSGSRIQANLPFSADSGPFTGSIPFAFSCASMPSSESTR